MNNLMLDLETMSTEPNALVFEIAIVPFDNDGKILDGHVHLLFHPKTGHIDPGTVAWWLKRADACSWTGGTNMSEAEAATWIHSYLGEHSQDRLWAMPAAFDCIILEQFLARNGHGPKLPIDFRLWRDLRTVREMAWWPKTEKRDGHTTHNAYDDCVRQIDTLAECWRLLRTVTNTEGKK